MKEKIVNLVFQVLEVRVIGSTQAKKVFNNVQIQFSDPTIYIAHPEYKYRIRVRDAEKFQPCEPQGIVLTWENQEFLFLSGASEKDYSKFLSLVQQCYDKRQRQRQPLNSTGSNKSITRNRKHPRSTIHQTNTHVDDYISRASPLQEVILSPIITENVDDSLQFSLQFLDDISDTPPPPAIQDRMVGHRRVRKCFGRHAKQRAIPDDSDADGDACQRSPIMTTPTVNRVVSPSTLNINSSVPENAMTLVDPNQRIITNFFAPKRVPDNIGTNEFSSKASLAASLSLLNPTTPDRSSFSSSRISNSNKLRQQEESWLKTPFQRDRACTLQPLGSLTVRRGPFSPNKHRFSSTNRSVITTTTATPTSLIKGMRLQLTSSPLHRSRTMDTAASIPILPMTPPINYETNEEVQRPGRFRGIRNLGNTCYCAASLQMLCSAFDFVNSIKSRGGKLSNSIVKASQELLTTDQEIVLPVDPRNVKEAIDSKTDQFSGYEQRDAHEFMGELVDAIHEELEEQTKNILSGEDGTPEKRFPTEDFRMTVQKVLKCTSCGYCRTIDEMYRCLSIDIVDGSGDQQQQQQPSVEMGLSHYFQPGMRELRCEKCIEGSQASETLFITERPRYLLLHLKRFIWAESSGSVKRIDKPPEGEENREPNEPVAKPDGYVFRKNKTAVSIPESLSLDQFFTSLDDKRTPLSSLTKYKLKSIVHHIGKRASSGHYTADAVRPCKNSNSTKIAKSLNTESLTVDKSRPDDVDSIIATQRDENSEIWVAFDDTFAQEVDGASILSSSSRQSSAYMLLYTLE